MTATTFLPIPDDGHCGPPRGRVTTHTPIPVDTPVRHYGTRQDAVIVGYDGPYHDGGGIWEYQVVTVAPMDGTHGPERPRWWSSRAVMTR